MATVGEFDSKALVDTMAKNLSEIKADTLAYTLGHVDSEALLDTLAHTVAEVEVEKPVDTICDMQALALVDVRACLLVWKMAKTRAATRGEKWRLRHWSRRWLTR